MRNRNNRLLVFQTFLTMSCLQFVDSWTLHPCQCYVEFVANWRTCWAVITPGYRSIRISMSCVLTTASRKFQNKYPPVVYWLIRVVANFSKSMGPQLNLRAYILHQEILLKINILKKRLCVVCRHYQVEHMNYLSFLQCLCDTIMLNCITGHKVNMVYIKSYLLLIFLPLKKLWSPT